MGFAKKIRFVFTVLVRAAKALVQLKTKLKVHRVEQNNSYVFEQGVLILDLEVQNALCFKIGNYKFLDGGIKYFSRQALDRQPHLTIYGLFQKQTFRIENVPTLRFESRSFDTRLNQLSEDFRFRHIDGLKIRETLPEAPALTINLPQVQFKTWNGLHINLTEFKLDEHL